MNKFNVYSFLRWSAVAFLFLLCKSLYAQENNGGVGEYISSKLFDRVSAKREEKLYLHFDRYSCCPGDTLWLRGYLFDAMTNKPVDYSRYIYVELTDRTDSVIYRDKIGRSIDDSLFVGYFIIPDNLSQGEYFIRSYTYLMQNQSVSCYDVKRVRIINPFDHRINVNCRVESRRSGRELHISFKNSHGTQLNNVDFLYHIPGEFDDLKLMSANTGYSGVYKVILKDTCSDCIYVRSPLGAKVDFESFIRLPNTKRDFSVSLMAEGGDIVYGDIQRVGVKSIGRDGYGVQANGVLYDENGNVITQFKTNQYGIGSFDYFVDDRIYYLILTSEDKVVKRVELPLPKSDLSVLRIDSDRNVVRVKILGDKSRDDYYLLVHSRGITLGVFDINVINGVPLDFSNAPEGIIHFLLLDEDYHVHSERLWFNRNYNRPQLNVECPVQNNIGRSDELVTLSFEKENLGIEGDFSVSVVNNSYTYVGKYDVGVDEYVFLTSELSGYVEDAGYYFENFDDVHDKALDDLLLTQGWRRFNVEHILKSDTVEKLDFYMERGQFLSGYVEDYLGRKSVNAEVHVEGSNGYEGYVHTNEYGEFMLDDLFFYEGTYFTATAKNSRGKDKVVVVWDEQYFENQFNNIPFSVFERNGDVEFYKKYGKEYVYSLNGERISTLGEVNVIKSYEQGYYEVLQDSLRLRASTLFALGITDVKDFGGYGNFYNGWGDKIVTPKKYDTGYSFYVPGGDMDDMEYYERVLKQYSVGSYKSSNMRSFKPFYKFVSTDMERPEIMGTVLNSELFWGTSGAQMSGVVNSMSIRTVGVYRPSVPHFELSLNVQTLSPLAPQLSEFVEFYQPQYNTIPVELKAKVDEYPTRYWNPRVRIGENQIFNVVFPRASIGDNYTITINGYTSDGTVIHFSKLIR